MVVMMIHRKAVAHSEEQSNKKKQPQIKHTLRPLLLWFEDICPQWNSALETGFSNNSRLDINDGKHCIVGEAHGFRDSAYICSKCWEYSHTFVSSVYGNKFCGYIIIDKELFEHLKRNFVKHFNQCHAEKKYQRSIKREDRKNVKIRRLRYLVKKHIHTCNKPISLPIVLKCIHMLAKLI